MLLDEISYVYQCISLNDKNIRDYSKFAVDNKLATDMELCFSTSMTKQVYIRIPVLFSLSFDTEKLIYGPNKCINFLPIVNFRSRY